MTAFDKAREIAENFANSKGSKYLSTERNGVLHLQSAIASAITAAVAATEARVNAEIDELSHLVQAECDNAIGLLRRAEYAEARVRELEAELRWLDDSGYLGFVAAKRVRRALGGAK